jgi:transcription-repair coupling factor (superfamily II helicase)
VSDATGLRRVLERLAPAIRADNARGTFSPSSFATPLSVAAYALENPFTLCVAATSSEAEQLRDSVAALLGTDDEAALWPGWDTHPLERVSPDNQAMATRALLRWRIAEGRAPRIIIASARSVAQILSPESIAAPLLVRRGGELDRDEFIAALAQRGYRRESLVEHRAEFAVRGGIVDLWPADGNEPIRLDFFGDEVERLTTFDIANQRSLHDLDEAIVAPAREWLLSEAARQRAERMIDAMPWGRSTFDRLATGQLFDGMEGWMPLFVDEPRTLLDELVGATVVVVEPDRVQGRLADLLDEERELTDAVAATWRATSERARGSYRRRSGPVTGRRERDAQSHVATDRPGRRGPNRRAPARVVDEASRRGAHLERLGGRANGRRVARRGPRGLDRRHPGARRAPHRAREFSGVGLQRR